MIIVSTESGRVFTIMEGKYYKNALELISLLQDNPDMPELRMVQATDGTYILTRCIITAKDA